MNVVRFRYVLSSADKLQFPALAGNTLRGALGVWSRTNDPTLFKLCFSADQSVTTRPFLIRANHLNNSTLIGGELFSFAIHLFSENHELPARLMDAIKGALAQGIGIGRGRAELIEVHRAVCDLDFSRQEHAQQLKVDFLSPTELKLDNLPATTFDFALLFRRIHGRLRLLAQAHGGELTMPEPGRLLLLANEITTVHSDLTRVNLRRHSTRTKKSHPAGGMIGSVTYGGGLSEFMPYLRAAELIGVGRQTVWGNGEISALILR